MQSSKLIHVSPPATLITSSFNQDYSSLLSTSGLEAKFTSVKKRPAVLRRSPKTCLQVNWFTLEQEPAVPKSEEKFPNVLTSPRTRPLLKRTTNLRESDRLNCNSEEASFWEPAEVELTEQELASPVVSAIAKRSAMKVKESIALLSRLGAFKYDDHFRDQQFEIPMNESFYELKNGEELANRGKKRKLKITNEDAPVFKRSIGELSLCGSVEQTKVRPEVPEIDQRENFENSEALAMQTKRSAVDTLEMEVAAMGLFKECLDNEPLSSEIDGKTLDEEDEE
ncbi:hypothetical protein HK096_009573 [Nowakowskiella sp. JEL0078]|nr:hypothetical protein HK096_009573 [Nowakowskiella sp. JEL0078]